MNDETLKKLQAALGAISEDDFNDVICAIDPVSWTEHRRMLKGQPFSFKNRDYLLQPYRDESKQIFFMKGRQVEMSEFSMNWLLRKLDAHPYTAGLHAFPRSAQAQKFSKQRLTAAINDSEYIKKWYDERNSDLMMRKFTHNQDGDGQQPYNFYMLGGTWESRKDTVGDAARGMSLDFIVYDERQDHPDDVETVLGEGASHSEFKQTLTLGTPKLPGIQFDQQWEVSDKKYWFVKCEHCGWEGPITMDNILDSGDEGKGYYYGCPHCKKELNRCNGRWLPQNPQRHPEYSGYHINQLMVAWIDANEIMRKKNSVSYPRRRFHNEVLGESYGGDDIPITIAMMESCCNNDYHLGETDGLESLYAGIDWGAKSWCIIQNANHRLIDCYIADDPDPRQHPIKIAKFIAKYGRAVKRTVCDAGPDITRAYALRDALKDMKSCRQVYACYYAVPPAKTDTVWNEKEEIVTVGRSEAIEKVIDEIHDGRFILPGADKGTERIDTLIDHFTNIAAERCETNSGNQYIMYTDTGPDHFLHAKVYADVASGNAVYVPISGQADPISNPRIPTYTMQNGILVPEKKSGCFARFVNRRRR